MVSDYLPLVRRALESLPAHDLEGSNVYVDERIFSADAPVRLGRLTVTAHAPSLLLFIDMAPAANWGHPCKYLLIGAEDGSVQVFDQEFPPPREHLRIVRRAQGTEDWTLLNRSNIEM